MLLKSTLALHYICSTSSADAADGDPEEKARRLTYELLHANPVVIDVRSCALEIVRNCSSAFAQGMFIVCIYTVCEYTFALDAHNVKTLVSACLDDGDLAAIAIRAYGELLLTCSTAHNGDVVEFFNVIRK